MNFGNTRNDLNALRQRYPHLHYTELRQIYERNRRDLTRTLEYLQQQDESNRDRQNLVEMQRLTANINEISTLFHSGQLSLCSQKCVHLLHNTRYNLCKNFRDSWCYMMLASCNRELGRISLKDFETSNSCLKSMSQAEVDCVKTFHPQLLDTMRWRLYHGIGMEFRLIDKKQSILYLTASLGVVNRILNNLENIKQKRRFVIGKATTLHNLGYLYSLMDEYSHSLECYQESASLWKSVDILKGLLFAHHNIGMVQLKLSCVDSAMESWEKVLRLSFLESEVYQPVDLVREHAPLLFEVLMNMGGVFEVKRNLEKSLEFYSRAREIVKNNLVNKKKLELKVVYRLANLFEKLGKKKRAKKYFLKCTKILEEMNNVVSDKKSEKKRGKQNQRNMMLQNEEMAIDVFISSAKQMIFLKDLDFAVEYLNNAIRIANRKNMRFIGSNLLIALGEVYQRMGEIEHATKAWKKSLQVKLEIVKTLPSQQASQSNSSSLPSLGDDTLSPYVQSLTNLMDRLIEASLIAGNPMEALRYAEIFKSLSLLIHLRRDESEFLKNLEKHILELTLPKIKDLSLHFYLFKPLNETKSEEKEGEEEHEELEEEEEFEKEGLEYRLVRWLVYDGRLLFHDVRDLSSLLSPFSSLPSFLESFRSIRTILPQVIQYLHQKHNTPNHQLDEYMESELSSQLNFCKKSFDLLLGQDLLSLIFEHSKKQNQTSSSSLSSSTIQPQTSSSSPSSSFLKRKLHHHHFHSVSLTHHKNQLSKREKISKKVTTSSSNNNEESSIPHLIISPHLDLFQFPFSVLLTSEKSLTYLIDHLSFSVCSSLHLLQLNISQREKIRHFRQCFRKKSDQSLYNRLRKEKFNSQIYFGRKKSFSRTTPRRRNPNYQSNIFHQNQNTSSFSIFNTPQKIETPQEEEEEEKQGEEEMKEELIKGIVLGDPHIKKKKKKNSSFSSSSTQFPMLTPIEEYSSGFASSPLKSPSPTSSYTKLEIQTIPKLVNSSSSKETPKDSRKDLVIVFLQKQAKQFFFLKCLKQKHPFFIHIATHTVFPSSSSGYFIFSSGERVYGKDIPHSWNCIKGCQFIYLSTCFGGCLMSPFFQIGIPSVISCVYKITDRVGYEISKGFYEYYFDTNEERMDLSKKMEQKIRESRKVNPVQLGRSPHRRRRYNFSENETGLHFQNKKKKMILEDKDDGFVKGSKAKCLRKSILKFVKEKEKVLFTRRIPFLFGAVQVFGEYN